jgi:hypothetical protein
MIHLDSYVDDHHPDDPYPVVDWTGQLCPYIDCAWWCELWAEGWYQCPNCGRYFYACESDSDYEDWKCYRDGGPMGNAPANVNVVAGSRGPSWATP